MQNKGTQTNRETGSPIDTWKSSEGQHSRKSTSNMSEGKSYQEQVSAFEDEGNIPTNQRVPSMSDINEYADRGLSEIKRGMRVAGEWIRENPALSIGAGLCLGFIFGNQIKKHVSQTA